MVSSFNVSDSLRLYKQQDMKSDNLFDSFIIAFNIKMPIEHFLVMKPDATFYTHFFLVISNFSAFNCCCLVLYLWTHFQSHKWIMISNCIYCEHMPRFLSWQRHKRLMSPLNLLRKPHHTDLMKREIYVETIYNVNLKHDNHLAHALVCGILVSRI